MAGSFLPPVIVELIADARKFNAGTTDAISGLKKVEAAGATTSARLAHVGQKAATGIIAGGVALAAVSVKMAGDFEGSMTKLVTGAGEAQKNIKMIHDGILEMGGQVGKTPKELADGMYYIGSAGFHGAEGLKVLKASAEGAAVGGADMMVVADGVTTALTNYGLSADKATGVTSGLIRSVSLGKTTLPEFAGALGKILPIASNMGISLSEAEAALSTMTASGMKADVAAESLRAMMTALISPTQEGAKVLAMIGLNGQKVSDMIRNPRIGLHGTLKTIGDLLGKKLPGQTALQEQAFQALTGGITGTSSRLLITGQHFKTFVGNIDAVGQSINGAKDKVLGFNKTQDTLQQKLAELKGAGQGILVGVGEALLPTAKDLADWTLKAIAFFKKHPLITEIAKDTALTAFGLSIAAKIKKGLEGIKSLFGVSAQAANTAATDLNTAAIEGLTAAMEVNSVADVAGGAAGAAGGAGRLAGLARGAGTLVGSGALTTGLVTGAIVAAGAVGMAYAANHPIQKLPPEFNTQGRARPDLQYAKLTKEYQDFRAKGGTDANWTAQRTAFLKSGHTNAQWLAGQAKIVMPKVVAPKTTTPVTVNVGYHDTGRRR